MRAAGAVGRYGGRAAKGAAVAGLLFAALPPYRLTAQETSLTIYSDGRVLVRRALPIAIARGGSTIGADLGVRQLDAGSLVSLDSGVQVVGARVSGAVGLEGSLRRAIGADLFFRVGSDTIPKYLRARVLSVDPPAVRLDGNVQYGWPGVPVFPDSLVQLSPHYELTLDADRPQRGLRLMYLSSGLSWHAVYTALLTRRGEGPAEIIGVAELSNPGGVTMAGAQVQLLAGDVRRASYEQPMRLQAGIAAAPQVSAIMVTPMEDVGEVHVYTLPGFVDFVPGETRTVSLFSSAAQVAKELTLRGTQFGINMQWPDAQRDEHPDVTYRLLRPSDSPFGATVVPGGILRLFEPDSSGRRQLVGEAAIPHTPVGRDILATIGTAFDVTAQRAQTEFQRSGNREATSGYTVELQNAKGEPVTVLVTDMCPGRCDVLASSVTPEPGPVNTLAFRVRVPANGSATLTYRVRARW